MSYKKNIGPRTYAFTSLKDLLAKASPGRSGDLLAGIAAESVRERAAAQMALADAYLSDFLREEIVPYDEGQVAARQRPLPRRSIDAPRRRGPDRNRVRHDSGRPDRKVREIGGAK